MAGYNHDWNSKVILFKQETTEGTDAVPTSALNAIRVLNLQPNFMDADGKTRALEKAFFGADPVYLANFKRGATFDMEIAGTGAPGAAPDWMKVAAICGFGAPVIVATTSATISPITSAIPSATLWQYLDDLLIKAEGGRGSMGFTLEEGSYPLLNFTYLGIPPTALASQAVPTAPTITPYATPLVAQTGNTTFTLDTYAVGLRRWTMNSNSQLELRALINPIDRIAYQNRSWSGEVVFEVPDMTVKDYFAKIRPGTTMPATAVHGVTAGNIVTVTCPALQITGNVAFSNEQGKVMATAPVTAIPVSGNDEISFAIT